MVATLNEQKKKNRWVLHLLNYIPQKNSMKVDNIEEVIPCFNIRISVKMDRPVKSIEAVPECKQLEFENTSGEVEFIIDRIDGHRMVSINFK